MTLDEVETVIGPPGNYLSTPGAYPQTMWLKLPEFYQWVDDEGIIAVRFDANRTVVEVIHIALNVRRESWLSRFWRRLRI
jgi:hypothetical protein